ncbi:unnamed protein product [Diatraea saccharalis]|uniref:Uncharacterized protein n=1 Tax=Diatraea saccharalis TaxID=40085 RepID=A0A9N9RCU4_9NEOP|nr:unnamed protein product [Diatraea saccharalis]
MAAQKVLILASAFLVQTVYSVPVYSGNTIIDNIITGNSGANGINVVNSGISSYGATNTGIGSASLINGYGNGFGLVGTGIGSGVGVNYGGIGSGVGVIGGGIGSGVGVIGGGIGSGVGVIGGNAGLNGVAFNLGGLTIGSSSPLIVTNISPIGPSGLALASENVIDGTLLVSGSLPFLSAVAFEGTLPTAGTGIATCGCGNGAVGITNV